MRVRWSLAPLVLVVLVALSACPGHQGGAEVRSGNDLMLVQEG